MSRWHDEWSRAVTAASDPTRLPAGVLAFAAGERHAAVLSLSAAGDALHLLLLARRDGSFVPWGEPVIEPSLTFGSSRDVDLTPPLKWTVGPVKIAEADRAVWVFGGELAQSSGEVAMQIGERRATGNVNNGYFVVIASDVPPEHCEVEVSAFTSSGQSKAGGHAIRFGPAVEIAEI